MLKDIIAQPEELDEYVADGTIYKNKFYKITWVANYVVGVAINTLKKWCERDDVPTYKVSEGNALYIKGEEIERFLFVKRVNYAKKDTARKTFGTSSEEQEQPSEYH